MEVFEESHPSTVIFVSIILGCSSSSILYIASHVEVPPSTLHVVLVNREVISDFLEAIGLHFFTVVLNAFLCRFFLKVKDKNYRIHKDERKMK